MLALVVVLAVLSSLAAGLAVGLRRVARSRREQIRRRTRTSPPGMSSDLGPMLRMLDGTWSKPRRPRR